MSSLSLSLLQHEPKSKKNGRISQHYKSSLSGTFHLYPVSIIYYSHHGNWDMRYLKLLV